MAYIEINDVSKVYQRVGEPFHALSHVSLASSFAFWALRAAEKQRC